MFKFHPKSWKVLLSLALAAVLVTILTLSVVAQQEPDSGEPPLPDKITVVEEEELRDSDRADNHYLFVSACTFVPIEEDMDYQYYSAGCVYRKGGNSYSNYSIQLPQGAEIDFLRIFFYDDDPNHNAMATLYSFSGDGDHDIIVSASSSGTPGQSSKGSGYIDPKHEVKNNKETLVLRLNYGAATTSDLRICGVRIQYKYSGMLSGTYIPLVTK